MLSAYLDGINVYRRDEKAMDELRSGTGDSTRDTLLTASSCCCCCCAVRLPGRYQRAQTGVSLVIHQTQPFVVVVLSVYLGGINV